MKSALPGFKLILLGRITRLYIFVLIAAFMLAGCGSQEDTAPSQTSTISFKLSDTLLGSRLDQTAGILTIFVSVDGGTPQPMTISGDGLTASITLNSINSGSRDFTIDIFYDDGSSGDLQVASGTKTITVVAGSNALNFVTGDFDSASFDADGDGLSNLVELDETSVSSPVDDVCVLGVSLIGNCTFDL